jgi:hypothetical protein
MHIENVKKKIIIKKLYMNLCINRKHNNKKFIKYRKSKINTPKNININNITINNIISNEQIKI